MLLSHRQNLLTQCLLLLHWSFLLIQYHNIYNFITCITKVSAILLTYLLFSKIHVLGCYIIAFALRIVFTITFTCFISIWIRCCTIELEFSVAWNINIFYKPLFYLHFHCYHIKYFKICLLFSEHIVLDIEHYNFHYIYLDLIMHRSNHAWFITLKQTFCSVGDLCYAY